jgi:4-aminobutyrate aminotransferase-like enzyme
MSNELTTRHRSVMPAWQALYYEEPIELVSGEGRYVVDREGRRYLDFFGGILTTSVGPQHSRSGRSHTRASREAPTRIDAVSRRADGAPRRTHRVAVDDS